MIDIDERLRNDAAAIRRQCDLAPLPPLPGRVAETPTRTRLALAVGVAAAVCAVSVAAIALLARPDRIASTDSVPVTEAPPDTAAAPATTPSSSPPPTVFTPTEPTVPEPVGEILDDFYPSFDDVPDGGAPVVLRTPPNGFRASFTTEGSPGWRSGGSGGLALIELDADGIATGNRIVIGINDLPPWQPDLWDEGGSPDGELVTIGELTGRWRTWSDVDQPPFFTAPIDDTHYLVVDGTLPRDEVERFIASIAFGDDVTAPTFDTLPGYLLVDTRVGIMNGASQWMVNYSTDDLAEQFLVTTTFRPAQPLAARLLTSRGARQEFVAGYPAILIDGSGPDIPGSDELIIDVRPDLRVQVTGIVTPDGSLAPSDHALDLTALASQLVAATPSGWSDIGAAADAVQATLPAIETPCATALADVTWDAGDAPTYSGEFMPGPAVEAGNPVDVTVTPAPGVRLDDVVIRITNPGAEVEFARLDSVTEPTTMTIVWDGVIQGSWEGEELPPEVLPGSFQVGVEATAVDLTGACEPRPYSGGGLELYVVPAP